MKSLVLAAVLSLVPAAALAQSAGMAGMDHKTMSKDHKSMARDNNALTTHRAVAVVKSVDVKARTVLLAHEPVKSLQWPAMTMSFKVADPAFFARLAPGNKVDFEFQQRGEDYIVTRVGSWK